MPASWLLSRLRANLIEANYHKTALINIKQLSILVPQFCPKFSIKCISEADAQLCKRAITQF